MRAEIFQLKMKIHKRYQKMKVQMMERRVTNCSDGWNVINLKELGRKQSRSISRHYPHIHL
jgi:hypothetical protein